MSNHKAGRMGFFILVLMLGTLGLCLIPANWTSIWMDPEFTDWVSPIADRLHDHARLYENGLHSPMPPLPFILVRLLHPNGAIWIHENLLNFIFQAATLLLLYRALVRPLGASLAFVCVVAAMPIFFSILKTILYDSMAQFLVAACGVCCAGLLRPEKSAVSFWQNLPQLVLQGLLMALLMLTKQSTGAGAVMGVSVALFVLPASGSFYRRCAHVIAALALMIIFICLLSLALSHFMSFSGMLYDVFQTGSEPKGGSKFILRNLSNYAVYLVTVMGITLSIFLIICWCFDRKYSLRKRFQTFETLFLGSDGTESASSVGFSKVLTITALLSLGSFITLYFLAGLSDGHYFSGAVNKLRLPLIFLSLGLVASIILTLTAAWAFLRARTSEFKHRVLAAYAIIFIAAALMHSLSRESFRWTFDNNPLVVLALACGLRPLVVPLTTCPFGGKYGGKIRLGLLCLCIIAFWFSARQQFANALRCTETWPEIKQLSGARMRPQASGMRELAAAVKSRADASHHDTVLLLPNDPNIEAWFERDRPALSSAIIFTDQYWDRYVDRDFAELTAHPPKVIVIGPRNFWRHFSHEWNVQRGTERLIDLVSERLLPAHYDLQVAQPIQRAGEADFMDVYVRRD